MEPSLFPLSQLPKASLFDLLHPEYIAFVKHLLNMIFFMVKSMTSRDIISSTSWKQQSANKS
jgi:hypothetical protein